MSIHQTNLVRRALLDLQERLKNDLAEVQDQLRGFGSGSESPHKKKAAKRGRERILSTEARKRIAAAQKKRWAEFRRNKCAEAIAK